jgi:hypothetical protein
MCSSLARIQYLILTAKINTQEHRKNVFLNNSLSRNNLFILSLVQFENVLSARTEEACFFNQSLSWNLTMLNSNQENLSSWLFFTSFS